MNCLLCEGPQANASENAGAPHLRLTATSIRAETGCLPEKSIKGSEVQCPGFSALGPSLCKVALNFLSTLNPGKSIHRWTRSNIVKGGLILATTGKGDPPPLSTCEPISQKKIWLPVGSLNQGVFCLSNMLSKDVICLI